MVIIGILATSASVGAPTFAYLLGETAQIAESNTILASRNTPIMKERQFIATFIDLDEIDGINRVLAYKGHYIGIEKILYELIDCESDFDNSRCGDNGLSCGILQYRKGTWDAYCEGDIKSEKDQIKCGIKMIMVGLGHTTGGWKNCWEKLSFPII